MYIVYHVFRADTLWKNMFFLDFSLSHSHIVLIYSYLGDNVIKPIIEIEANTRILKSGDNNSILKNIDWLVFNFSYRKILDSAVFIFLGLGSVLKTFNGFLTYNIFLTHKPFEFFNTWTDFINGSGNMLLRVVTQLR